MVGLVAFSEDVGEKQRTQRGHFHGEPRSTDVFFGPRAPGPPEVPNHGPTLSLPGGSRDGGGHRAVHVGLPTGETVGLPTRTI